jgi:hypothetical protein
MVRNWGAVLALAVLIGLAAIGFLFFDLPHCYENSESCNAQQHYSAINDDHPSALVSIGNWATANREAIDALSAIGSVTFAFALVVFTGVLATKTSGLHAETAALRTAADQQSKDMVRSIAASTRAAEAMEQVGRTLGQTNEINKGIVISQREAWQQQMRAYISADTGASIRQKKGLKFEFRPNITNHGLTPAIYVKTIIKCDIRHGNIPVQFDYSVDDNDVLSSATLFPRQNKFVSTIFARHLDRSEMREIIRWNSFFHVWGTIFYEDAFQMARRTNFSFRIRVPGQKKGIVLWQLTDLHNDTS